MTTLSLFAQVPGTARAETPAAPVTPAPAETPTAPATPAPAVTPAAPATPAPAETPAADLSEIQAALAEDTGSASSVTPAEPAPRSAGGVQSMNPELSLIADFALAAFSDSEHHQTGGHDPAQNGFNLQALELSLGSAVDPYFRFDANIVFGLEEVEIEEAYATTLDLGGRFQARIGQFLTRFGRANPTHPHSWNFVDQPFWLGRVFGGEGNRGLGVELSYLTPLPWYVELVLSSTLASGEGTARSFYADDDLGVNDPRDLLYVAAIKQFFPLSHDWSLAFGVSSAFGPNASASDAHSEIYGADLYLKYKPISEPGSTEVGLQAEWLYRRRELAEGVLDDAGGYLELVTKFARRYAVGARYELGSPSYDRERHVAVDPLDPDWTDLRSRSSLALTHTPSEFSRFRLQGSRDTGLGHTVWAAFLAAEFVTGAHGAHQF